MSGCVNLFILNRIKILIIFVIFLTQKSPITSCLEEVATEVDVLQVLKPINEFQEFDTYVKEATGIPDYKFEISNVSPLVFFKSSELEGKKFQLPGLNLKAQIKCNVKYHEMQFSIRFLHWKNEETQEKVELNDDELLLITTALINNNDNNVQEEKQSYRNESFVFPFDQQLLYGSYYPFLSMRYRTAAPYIRNTSDSIILHLYVRKVVPPLDNNNNNTRFSEDGNVFFWKIDVSNFTRWGNHYPFADETQLALSPFIYSAGNTFKVQLRIFLRQRKCHAEVRLLSLNSAAGRSFPLELSATHPTDHTQRISVKFNVWSKYLMGKTSMITEVANYFQLLSYSRHNKLRLVFQAQQST